MNSKLLFVMLFTLVVVIDLANGQYINVDKRECKADGEECESFDDCCDDLDCRCIQHLCKLKFILIEQPEVFFSIVSFSMLLRL